MLKNIFRKPLINLLNNHIIDYPTPINLNYLWSFGSLAGLCLTIQIITGVLLAMHYTPEINSAFNSIMHIMRDVNYGWLLRYTHLNGASMFFIFVYLHIARGLYFGSYSKPRKLLWCSGIAIFIIMMATAFMGYVLPWGQMSFWGATVITNLFSAIPYIGKHISFWIWGGFSVSNATLNRFFSLHYILPFIILALVIVHLSLLHLNGSNNPLGFKTNIDNISFYPYFYIKDLLAFFLFIFFFSIFVFFFPNLMNHPDNYIEANPLVTPPHIVPEWYFLPFYAILRAIPNKLGGVVCMFGSLLVLLLLPFFINSINVRSSKFDIGYQLFYWLFIFDVLFLGFLGSKPVESPYILLGQLATFYYFFFFFFIIPFFKK